MTTDPARLFSERTDSYLRFIRAVLYPQGIRAYFLSAPYLRPGVRVLDAGCGTGVVTLGLHEALMRRGFVPGTMHAFDLTPAMLDRFRERLATVPSPIELAAADVLHLDRLPAGWRDYDLIVTASMLELAGFPLRFRHLALWGHVVVADNPSASAGASQP